MTKVESAIRKLAEQGWTVSRCGVVLRPDGTERSTVIKKGKGRRPDYLCFNTKVDGISYPVPVHKFVAFLKFGPKSFNWLVRHLDGDSLNNSWGNLDLGDGTDNAMDRPRSERIKHAMKAAAVLRKFSPETISYIRASSDTSGSLARKFDVSKSTISGIRNGKLYRDVL